MNEVQIPIVAVEAGTGGNVGRGEIRSVADKRLRVFNDQSTAGGTEQSFAVVMPSDYSAASTKLDQAVEANVLHTIRELRERSRSLREREERGQVRMAGAVYDLATGSVRVVT